MEATIMGEQNGNEQVNCLFNLVIYTSEEERTAYFGKLFAKISEKFPSRIIFIQLTDKPSAEKDLIKRLQVEGSNKTTKPGEQFIIKASAEQLKQVPFTLLPMLIPDLPIYLIWGQNPVLDKVILPQLQKFATRLVYDSECDRNLQNFSQDMLKKIGELKCDFMDIDWALISGWRDVISQVFDNQAHFDVLQDCKSIDIKYNILDTTPLKRKATQAIYFQGWIAAQLGWQYCSFEKDKDLFKIQYAHDKDEVTVTLHPVEKQNLAPGSLVEVGLVSSRDSSLSFSLDEKQSKILVYYSTPERCELPFSLPLPNLQRGLSFMKEVFYHRADQHYLNMLSIISKTPWNAEK